jgi:DNA-directed RNA polymerase subunit L
VQWFKNGDHPDDYRDERPVIIDGDLKTIPGAYAWACGWEGRIVRYYRHPDTSGEERCAVCGHPFHEHGWIDAQNLTVCPGYWVLDHKTHYEVLSPREFETRYILATIAEQGADATLLELLDEALDTQHHVTAAMRMSHAKLMTVRATMRRYANMIEDCAEYGILHVLHRIKDGIRILEAEIERRKSLCTDPENPGADAAP